jgi:hypothetical protein
VGFPGRANARELQEIEEINSLLVGGEQRGLSQQSLPILSSTLYQLRLNQSRPQSFHRGSAQHPKLAFSDHPDMRVLHPGQGHPVRRASAPQLGFHASETTPQPMPRQLPFLYSGLYSPPDVTQHPIGTHQQPGAAASTFDMSFSSFVNTSSSRPTTSGSDFSTSSAESVIGFSSDHASPSLSPADDPGFEYYQGTNLVKMENGAGGVDLVGWSGPGFFGFDQMGGFETFGNVPQC